MAPPMPADPKSALDLLCRIAASDFAWTDDDITRMCEQLGLQPPGHWPTIGWGGGSTIEVDRLGSRVQGLSVSWPMAGDAMRDQLRQLATEKLGGADEPDRWKLPTRPLLRVETDRGMPRAYVGPAVPAVSPDPDRTVDTMVAMAEVWDGTRSSLAEAAAHAGLTYDDENGFGGLEGFDPTRWHADDVRMVVLSQEWRVDEPAALHTRARIAAHRCLGQGPARVRTSQGHRDMWRLPSGHELGVQTYGSWVTVMLFNREFAHRQLQPQQPQALADAVAHTAAAAVDGTPPDRLRATARTHLVGDDTAWPHIISFGQADNEWDQQEPPFFMHVLPEAGPARVTMDALWAEDHPRATLQQLFDLQSSALWQRWGLATSETPEARVWQRPGWRVECRRDEARGFVRVVAEQKGQPEAPAAPSEPAAPAGPTDATAMSSAGLIRTARRPRGLPTAEFSSAVSVVRSVLRGAWQFDVASLPALAVALGTDRIDPADADEDGDIFVRSRLGGNQWNVSAADAPGRFKALVLPFDTDQLDADDRSDAVRWLSEDLGADPDERADDHDSWHMPTGTVSLRVTRGFLLIVVAAPSGPVTWQPPVPAELAYDLRVLHDALDGGFRFDLATLPALSRAVGVVIDPENDRDADGDLVFDNPLSSRFMWVLTADPADRNRFTRLVATSEIPWRQAVDLAPHVVFDNRPQPPPHERTETQASWYHTAGTLHIMQSSAGSSLVATYDGRGEQHAPAEPAAPTPPPGARATADAVADLADELTSGSLEGLGSDPLSMIALAGVIGGEGGASASFDPAEGIHRYRRRAEPHLVTVRPSQRGLPFDLLQITVLRSDDLGGAPTRALWELQCASLERRWGTPEGQTQGARTWTRGPWVVGCSWDDEARDVAVLVVPR